MSRFRVTEHARMRMRQRRISWDQVIRTLHSPDHREPVRDGRQRLVSWFGRRRLVLIVQPLEAGDWLLVTVYWKD